MTCRRSPLHDLLYIISCSALFFAPRLSNSLRRQRRSSYNISSRLMPCESTKEKKFYMSTANCPGYPTVGLGARLYIVKRFVLPGWMD